MVWLPYNGYYTLHQGYDNYCCSEPAGYGYYPYQEFHMPNLHDRYEYYNTPTSDTDFSYEVN